MYLSKLVDRHCSTDRRTDTLGSLIITSIRQLMTPSVASAVGPRHLKGWLTNATIFAQVIAASLRTRASVEETYGSTLWCTSTMTWLLGRDSDPRVRSDSSTSSGELLTALFTLSCECVFWLPPWLMDIETPMPMPATPSPADTEVSYRMRRGGI